MKYIEEKISTQKISTWHAYKATKSDFFIFVVSVVLKLSDSVKIIINKQNNYQILYNIKLNLILLNFIPLALIAILNEKRQESSHHRISLTCLCLGKLCVQWLLKLPFRIVNGIAIYYQYSRKKCLVC